jgi:hypothetical protein
MNNGIFSMAHKKTSPKGLFAPFMRNKKRIEEKVRKTSLCFVVESVLRARTPNAKTGKRKLAKMKMGFVVKIV